MELSLKRAHWILYFFLLTACFLLFKQSDLTHTYTSSYAYLNGHFSDFYDYNKTYVGGNDYLPLLYWIFAVWFIPLKALNLLPVAMDSTWQVTSAIEVIWAKLLLTAFFVACLIQLWHLTQVLRVSRSRSIEIVNLFASSPFVIFAVFIFSQYDIIGVYFVLLGLTAYFQKRWVKFVFWFSIAISLKYFALIIFVPILLIAEKRIKYLVVYFLMALLPTLIQIALYWHSTVFLAEIFTLAGGKAGDALGRSIAVLLIGIYGLLCLYTYFTKIKPEQQNYIWYLVTIFSALLAYDLMFSMVRWHPHWVVIIAPFICLSYFFINSRRALILLEIFAFLGFMVICVNTWERNADIAMAYQGIFGALLPTSTLIGKDILSYELMPLSRLAFYVYLYSPLLLLILESVINKFKGGSFRVMVLKAWNESSELNPAWYLLRYVVGTCSFIFLLIICIYQNPSI